MLKKKAESTVQLMSITVSTFIHSHSKLLSQEQWERNEKLLHMSFTVVKRESIEEC